MTLAIVIGLIAVALAFDFLNGFHDAANSIATIVSTRVLAPTYAVAWAAFFNFIAAFGGGVKVANTMGNANALITEAGHYEKVRGRHVEFVAAITAQDGDPSTGNAKRPRKAKFLPQPAPADELPAAA